MNRIFWKTAEQKVAAYKLLELIDDYGLTDNPIIFHIFSNGGAMIYRHITEILHGTEKDSFKMLQMKGCIFDSGPAPRKISIGAKALMSSMGQTNILIKYMAALSFVWFMLVIYLMSIIAHLVGIEHKFPMLRHTQFWEALISDKSKSPQMFLYSKIDEVTPYKYIEEFIEERKALGVKVESVRFDDSPHVGHLRMHRESYINQCHRFLASCCN